MLCIWWTSRQVEQYELLETCQIITAELSLHQLKNIQKVLKEEEPALVNHSCVLFLHYNSKSHLAQWPLIPYGDWLGETVTSPLPRDIAPTDCPTSIPFVGNSLEIR